MALKLKNYDVLEFIGAGAFGTCYKIKQKSDNKILVWKVIDFSAATEKEKQLIVGEVNALRKLNHPNILLYVGKILDKPNSLLYIITGYCEGGDLAKYITNTRKTRNRQNIPESFIWKIFCQLTLALDVCHDTSKNGTMILHRDIKPSNVYLNANEDAVLGDFGVARSLSERSVYASTFVGSHFYMSPEILANKPYNDKTDVWSLGCLIHELCCLLPPFIPRKDENIYKKIIKGERIAIPDTYSELIRSVVDRMLIVDFKKRPSIRELLNLGTLTMIYKNVQPARNELQPEVKKEPNRSRSPQPGKREALAEKEKNIQLSKVQPARNELQPEVKKGRNRSRSRSLQPGEREALAEKEKNIQLRKVQPAQNELQPEVKKGRNRSRSPQPGEREALAEKEKNIQLREIQLDEREKELKKKEISLNLQCKLIKEKSERDNEYARLCEQLGLHSLKRPLTKESREPFRISMGKTLTRSQPIPQRVNSSDDSNQYASIKIYPAHQFVRCVDQTKRQILKTTDENKRDALSTINFRLQKAQQKALRLRIAEINSKMKTSPF